MSDKLTPLEQRAAIQTLQNALDKLWDKNDIPVYDGFYRAAMNALITLENAVEVDIAPEYKGKPLADFKIKR